MKNDLPRFKFELKKDEVRKCTSKPEKEGDPMCKLSYKYGTVMLRRFLDETLMKNYVAKYYVQSKPDAHVVYNRVAYSPDMVYLINPAGIEEINQSTTGGTNKRNDIEKLFPIWREDRVKVGKDATIREMIISHSAKSGNLSEHLWVVIPINIEVSGDSSKEEEVPGSDHGDSDPNIYIKSDNKNNDKGNLPMGTSQVEVGLRTMYEKWVEAMVYEEDGMPTLQMKPFPMELQGVIPTSTAESPYTYIEWDDRDTTVKHHVIYFKKKYANRIYYLGKIDRYNEAVRNAREEIEDNNFEGFTLSEDRMEASSGKIYEPEDIGVLKDLNNYIRSRRNVNMKCKPVLIDGRNYGGSKYVVAKEEKEKGEKVKEILGKNKFFGIAFVVLVLMLLILPVGIHYLTKVE